MPPKKAQAAQSTQTAAAKSKPDKKSDKDLPSRSKEEETKTEKQNGTTKEKPKEEPRKNSKADKLVADAKEVKSDKMDVDKQDKKPAIQKPDTKSNSKPAENKQDETEGESKKRKSPPTSAEPKDKKVPRQGSRVSSRQADTKDGKSADPTPKQLLNFLLSSGCLEYCYPSEELEFAREVKKGDKKTKSYSLTQPSQFTPFEHLVISHLLSKPLSHTLGMRSIRTLLNAPYNFSSAAAITKAGEDKVWEALEKARTQHRQKTASYIYQMAENYVDKSTDDDSMYQLSVEANENGPHGVISHITDTVKGLGKIGGEIFCRRIQCVDGWGDAVWPYADPRSIDALREIGIKVADAEELQGAIEREVDFDIIKKNGGLGLSAVDDKFKDDYEMQVQVELVVVLERAVGCALEGKVSELRRAAAKA